MQSRRDDVDHRLAVRRALELGLCGIGEPLEERAAARLERFCAVPDGSFVWTLDDTSFRLGRLAGPCRRDDDRGAAAADLVHVRPCEWLAEPVDPLLVPEQVGYAFSRGGRNFQRIGLPGAGEATARVWDQMA
ncbi:GAF domain-containing protein [Nocardioides coralli]|uniref:GAF domain-containing protein n=1 Tax=Nocardioides coralli TaxID=2872154 RepID=UPI002017A0DD|nr:GAF domain-containing protein [Nocardioides coralli]